MALHFELKVNGKPIGSFYARRLNPGIPRPSTINSYEYSVEADGKTYEGEVQHRFGDGAWILVRKVLESVEQSERGK